MPLRRDHVAGGLTAAFGLGVIAISGDLPVGSMASPGAGMLPMLAAGLIVTFGAVLLVRASASPPLRDITWPDLPHAARVAVLTGASLLVYERLGFITTITALLLVLLLLIERRPFWSSVLFSFAVPAGAYLLLAKLLKSQLPVGPFGF
jgi:hypothetical protein